MADKVESTVEEPLKFFQDMFLGNGYKSFRQNFFAQSDGYDIIKKTEDEISYYVDTYNENNGETLYNVVRSRSFTKELSVRLNSEYKHTLQLIKSAIANITYRGNDNLLSYLDLQHIHIQELLTHAQTVSKAYPFTEEYLNQIKFLIETEQNRISPKVIVEIIEHENSISKEILDQALYTKDDLVDDLFGFLKDEYMSTTEWEYLITYLKSFIIEYKVPHIEQVFSLKKGRPVVKYLFYKLFSSLLNSRGHADKFSEFYLRAFENPSPSINEIKNISKKFSTIPTLPENFPVVNKMV